MDSRSSLVNAFEAYRAYFKDMKNGCEPKVYGVFIQAKRKKKKRR